MADKDAQNQNLQQQLTTQITQSTLLKQDLEILNSKVEQMKESANKD